MTATTPPQGNAIVTNSLPWHGWLVAALIVGAGIWLIEQNVDERAAMILTGIILLGLMYKTPGFSSEFQSIVSGSFN